MGEISRVRDVLVHESHLEEGFCPAPTRSRRRDTDAISGCRRLSVARLPTPTALSCRCHRQGQWSRRFLCRLAPSPCHTHAGHACPLRHPLDNFKVMRCAAAVQVWSENAEYLAYCIPDVRSWSFMFDTRAQLARQIALEA